MAGTLTASFARRFAGGMLIRAEFSCPVLAPSVTVLFGPSGCGKTTVLRCLAGLEKPDEGTIRFNAETWFDSRQNIHLAPQSRGVGFVFQDYALFPHLSVAGNIAYGLRGTPPEARRKIVGDFIERFSLRGLKQRRPYQLSSGQQQRVALARSLAPQPRLLLLDEPLAALDAALREELRSELRHLLAAAKIPVLLVTHDRAEALALGDAIIVMADGAVRQSGSVIEVFNQPADAAVAKILGVETIQPGGILSRHEGLATVKIGAVILTALAPLVETDDVFVCIRGEDVVIQPDAINAESSARNRLRARITGLRHEGPLVRVELDAGFPLHALITRPACAELALQVGETITASIKAPAIHLVPR